MDHVVQMLKDGSLRPPFFDYPGLVFYLQLPVAGLRFLIGAATGEWTSLDAVSASHFYLWARVFTALLGVGTVYLVYRIGLRWGHGHALLAAALLAVMPTHVRESRFALTDVPMTFFVTLALLLTLRAHERGSWLRFGWAGVAVGLGTAVKYTAGAALLVPLAAVWLTSGLRQSRGRSTAVVAGGFAFAFVLGAPYAILDWQGFVTGVAGLAAQYAPRDPAGDHAAWIYLKHLRLNLHWPAFTLAVIGLLVSATKLLISRPRVPPALIVLFPVVFVLALGNYSPIFARYVLPVVPFACLAAAIAVFAMVNALTRVAGRRTIVAAQLALAALAILPMALHSGAYVRGTSVESTQTLAYRWLVENLPPGAVVVIEQGAMRFPADLFTSVFVRRLTDQAIGEYVRSGAQCLVQVLAADPAAAPDHPREIDEAYDELLGDDTEVVDIRSSTTNPGLNLRIIRMAPPR